MKPLLCETLKRCRSISVPGPAMAPLFDKGLLLRRPLPSPWARNVLRSHSVAAAGHVFGEESDAARPYRSGARRAAGWSYHVPDERRDEACLVQRDARRASALDAEPLRDSAGGLPRTSPLRRTAGVRKIRGQSVG